MYLRRSRRGVLGAAAALVLVVMAPALAAPPPDDPVQQGTQPTTLHLSASPGRVYKDETSHLVAHLDAFDDTQNQEVSIYRTPKGGKQQLLVTGTFDAAGDFAVDVSIAKRTTYVAEWTGDDTYAPAESEPVTVYLGVKSGRWEGRTAQDRTVRFQVGRGIHITSFQIAFRINFSNCPGHVVIRSRVNYRRPLKISNDHFEVDLTDGPVEGTASGTFSSRGSADGTLDASFEARRSGCRGDLGNGIVWSASRP